MNEEPASRLGEIVESSTTEFTVQSYVLHEVPPLGSMIRAGAPSVGGSGGPESSILGVVYYAETTSLDRSRKPIARGRDLASEAAIFDENPQLAHLLRSDFRALVVGFSEGQRISHHLPPRPPRVHAFVYQCSAAEIREFTDRFDFLDLITSATIPIPIEELLAACVRQAVAARGGDRGFLIQAGRHLARLLGSDTARLSSVLRRLRSADGTAGPDAVIPVAGQNGSPLLPSADGHKE